MPKIRILPEQLANRIAAGEVVERPASVVKELIENSLDSGATRIEVEVEGGGTRSIRIIDNGEGMDEDDILLCFERHGTSKIDDDHDLVAINTLGFRGEAIPSIASVSKMTVTSRPKDSSFGTTVQFEYGRLQKVHETGCSRGTVIEVRNLFGRTPARKKFLRTHRTEIGHIDEIIKNHALACTDIVFSLRVDGKETLLLNTSHNLEGRLSRIMHYQGDFIQIGAPFRDSNTRQLHGLLVPPHEPVSGSARLRLFINGRSIKNRTMSHGIAEGLRGFLLKGHSPAGYLHLRLPAEEVDVNVHPAKHEVRFRNNSDIHQFIKQSVETAMQGYQSTIRSTLFGHPETQSVRITPASDSTERRALEESFEHTQSFTSRLPETRSQPGTFRNEKLVSEPQKMFLSPSVDPLPETQAPPTTLTPQYSALNETQFPEYTTQGTGHGMRIIGQFKNLYIFCHSGDNMIVIDQHAAHERLLYEKFLKQYLSGRVSSQNLLFPETVELTPNQIELTETNRDEIERMGFSLREFGGNSYIISAVPAIAGRCNTDELFFDMLDRFGKESGRNSNSGRLEDILATMACKAAVKSGDILTDQEIDALLKRMADADLFSHCPHGRPVFKSLSTEEIKKWFHRT